MNAFREEKQERWLAGDTGFESSSFEHEVLNDPELADDVYTALALEAALKEAADQDVIPDRQIPRGGWVWAGTLVAATLAFFVLLPQFQQPGQDVALRLRGAGDTGAAVCIEPLGALDHFPRSFTWRPASTSLDTRYRWELYDAQARRRGISVVADTTFSRNASLTPVDSTGNWLWLVIELKADGNEGRTSAAVRFTVEPKDKN